MAIASDSIDSDSGLRDLVLTSFGGGVVPLQTHANRGSIVGNDA